MDKSPPPEEDFGPAIPYDPDFNGPLKNRSCTDVICLLLFIVFFGGWIGIGIYAFTSGDPSTLLIPKDSFGGRCGLDEHVKDKPYLFFFDLMKCLQPQVPFTGCPTTQICVEKCPEEYFSWTLTPDPAYLNKLICTYDVTSPSASDVEQGKCAGLYYKSNPFLNRCVFNPDPKSLTKERIQKDEIDKIKMHLQMFTSWIFTAVQNVISVFTDDQSWQQFGQNIVEDIITARWKILLGVILAVGVCIFYIVIMRWIAAVMVWFSMIGVVALLTAGVYFSATKYADLKKNPVKSESNNMFQSYLTKKDTWLTLLIISSVVLAIILLVLIFLRKRILLAIALIKEGSKAVSAVTSVLIFPIFPWVLQLLVIAFGITVTLFLTTTGNPIYRIRDMDSDSCTCNGINYQNDTICDPAQFRLCTDTCLNTGAKCKFLYMENPSFYPYIQAINIFGLLWGSFFVSALGQMILASIFATWYWTFSKANVPFFAVTTATLRVLRYHIGTLAFGSLIITICRAIRIVLEYIDQKLKQYDNEFTKAIMCCCKCFFWCLEKFLKFINQNAYIMCAIHGKHFCGSAKDAFLLLMRNIVRVFVLDKVTDFLFFIGKVVITLGVGATSYVIFATDLTSIDNSGLNYALVPVIVIMVCTYLVSTIFFNVYSMAVDTLFLCFLEDCERNDGSAEKPYYMSKNLMRIFGKKNKID